LSANALNSSCYGVALRAMSTPESDKRRTVNINEKIAEELNRIANQEGKTLYSLINEIAVIGIDAYRRGFPLKDAVETRVFLDRVKRSRMILVNQDLWYTASGIAYRKDRNGWLNKAYEKAKWYGRLLSEESSDESFTESLRKMLYNLFWDCNEVQIRKNGEDTFDLRVFFIPEMPLQHASVVLRMVEGLLNSSGYAILRHTAEQGYLTILFKRVPLPDMQQ